ncbi:uncharacterized protein [Clytia hemisphaerica]
MMDEESDNALTRCPTNVKTLAANVIAPYWLEYDRGTVHAFKHNNDRRQLRSDVLKRIVDEFNVAFGNGAVDFWAKDVRSPIKGRTMSVSSIDEINVFTWNNMYNTINTKTLLRKRHLFQVALIKLTNGQLYAKFIYDTLGANGNVNFLDRSQDTPCGRAEIGIGIEFPPRPQFKQERSFNDEFPLNDPREFEEISNEYPFSHSGNYFFDLNADSYNQPFPPTLKRCSKPGCYLTPEAQYFFQEQQGRPGQPGAPGENRPSQAEAEQELNRFCKNRDDGPHQLAAFCDVFIYCSNNIGSYETCKNGTKFNPEVLGCDHAVNFECAYSGLDLSGILPLIRQPASKHNNLCYFKGYGEIPDPLTCDHFYACTNSRSIRMPCPGGLFFQPTGERSGQCNYPDEVACKNGDRSVKKPFHPKNLH